MGKIEFDEKIEISVAEYTALKDMQTRFEILKNQMMHAEYCPIHTQIILGIENEYAAKHKEIEIPSFMNKSFAVPQEEK